MSLLLELARGSPPQSTWVNPLRSAEKARVCVPFTGVSHTRQIFPLASHALKHVRQTPNFRSRGERLIAFLAVIWPQL